VGFEKNEEVIKFELKLRHNNYHKKGSKRNENRRLF
jgi:hypothetical protein